jgi:hypothetical protein
MRSAIELAQDSIPSSAASTNPAVPVFSTPPWVSRSSVCDRRPVGVAFGISVNASGGKIVVDDPKSFGLHSDVFDMSIDRLRRQRAVGFLKSGLRSRS